MKIGLWNLEPKIKNTALMQISQYHKERGDSVEWFSPLFQYDRVYVSSLFSFTRKPKLKPYMVAGGSGFNVCSKLPPEIEACNLDYSIYPECRDSFLWFSRGCVRKCPFCVVPTSEGSIRSVLPKNLNPNGCRVSVMDNNFFANPHWKDAILYLEQIGQKVDFQCGFDARFWRTEFADALKNIKPYKQFRTAWDDPREDLVPKLKQMVSELGKSKLMVYVLIGYWSTPEQDLWRVMRIRELGLDAWVMPYNKQDPYQKAFERWNNRHANCEWWEYDRTKCERSKREFMKIPQNK